MYNYWLRLEYRGVKTMYSIRPLYVADTTIAETTTIEGKLSEKTTVLEAIEPDLFTGFEDTTAVTKRV